MRRGFRRGGTLFPVLMLVSVLFFLGAMLPQLLTVAGWAIKNDATREEVLHAAENATAIAEARLKRVVSEAVIDDRPWRVGQFELSPAPDNPDYGARRPADWRVKLLELKLLDKQVDDERERHRFTYRLRTDAWNRSKRQRAALAANGILTVNVELPRSATGLAARTLGEVTFQAMNQELPGAAP